MRATTAHIYALRTLARAQGWWMLCTATLCALPLTIWEFKNQGFSPHYQGEGSGEGERSHATAEAMPEGEGGWSRRRAPRRAAAPRPKHANTREPPAPPKTRPLLTRSLVRRRHLRDPHGPHLRLRGRHAHRVLHAPAAAAPRDTDPLDGAHLLGRRVARAALQGGVRGWQGAGESGRQAVKLVAEGEQTGPEAERDRRTGPHASSLPPTHKPTALHHTAPHRTRWHPPGS